ncbi:MAG: hypothetical protein OQK57_04945 [Ignavibacteriaceae bacterium]|nr:hypothetical protein [Ignavibacteriaceae bacterium]
MILKSTKYLFVLLIIFAAIAFPQSERFTKGAENGYTWIRMEDASRPYNTSKENYLGSILDRFRLTGERYPEIESLSCREDNEKLFSEGKSGEISLEDIVKGIDTFYSRSDNMIIPIIFAYCYSIKKFAGASFKELNAYKEKVILFCKE